MGWVGALNQTLIRCYESEVVPLILVAADASTPFGAVFSVADSSQAAGIRFGGVVVLNPWAPSMPVRYLGVSGRREVAKGGVVTADIPLDIALALSF